MKTITIEDPAEVGELLDREFGTECGSHHAMFTRHGWSAVHYRTGIEAVRGSGATPAELVENLRAAIAAADPLTKLRKEAEAQGFALTPLPG
jgi:hypothetical protein